jgi:hypothetical protein
MLYGADIVVFLSHKYETHQHSVGRAYSCWMLKLLMLHATSKRLMHKGMENCIKEYTAIKCIVYLQVTYRKYLQMYGTHTIYQVRGFYVFSWHGFLYVAAVYFRRL